MSMFDWSRLLLLSLVWGGSFFFVEVALPHADPLTIVFYRVAIAAVALWLYCVVIRETIPRSAGIWGAFMVMGILNNVIPFTLITWGQTEVTAGLASILNATTPLFAVAVGHYWPDGERATPNKIAGIVIGLIGMVVLIGPSILGASGSVLGQVAILGSSLSYALAANYGRRLLKRVSPIVSAAGMLAASSLVMLPMAIAFETPFAPLPVSAWLALLGLSLLCAAVAYILYFGILESAGPTNLMLVTFLIPVSAIALGVFFLGEQIDLRQMTGLALIFAGLACVDGRLLRRRTKASS